MRLLWFVAIAASFCLYLTGCSSPERSTSSNKRAQQPASDAPKITQFYATNPNLPRGEKGLLCYGVENTKTVWLEPPRQELSAALTRCVEVNPAGTTTYTLTAEGAAGPPAKQSVTVTVGAPRVHIVEVNVSSLTLKAGEKVTLCVNARNAAAVDIEPLHFHSTHATGARACTDDHPQKTTTYTVSAIGAGGDKDEERVTVQVH